MKQYAKADDGRWWLSEYQAENDSFSFASLDLEISLNDIYEEVEFS